MLAASTVVAGFFGYIYGLKRQSYLLLWAVGWTMFALHHLGPVLAMWRAETAYQLALDHWFYALAAVFFFVGAQLYAQRKPWKLGAGVVAGVVASWAAANSLHLFEVVPVVVPSALLFVAVAVVFWDASRRQETLADRVLGISFVAWGALDLAVYFFTRNASGDFAGMRGVGALAAAFVGLLIVVA